MSTSRLPNGTPVTRAQATASLIAREVEYYLSPPSGQITTVARTAGVTVTQSTLPDGMIEVRLGKPRHERPTGLESPMANLVAVLTTNEREQLKRLLTKLIAAM